MPTVVIVDTSVFLNALDVPGYNQHRDEVLSELGRLTQETGTSLLLPFASIIETGNHISHIADGQQRRRYAQFFADQVRQALDGRAPWTPTPASDNKDLSDLLERFPDFAMREIGIADLTIVREWELACSRHARSRVYVWALDNHLVACDRAAVGI